MRCRIGIPQRSRLLRWSLYLFWVFIFHWGSLGTRQLIFISFTKNVLENLILILCISLIRWLGRVCDILFHLNHCNLILWWLGLRLIILFTFDCYALLILGRCRMISFQSPFFEYVTIWLIHLFLSLNFIFKFKMVQILF